jgi:hypothetical protein
VPFRGSSLVVKCKGLPLAFAGDSPVLISTLIVADWS